MNELTMTESEKKNQTFFRRNWIGILGIIVALLGIVLSYYFYMRSKAEREPIFLVDLLRTIVIDSKSFPKTTLKVIKENNIPVEDDVISIRFYFWNNGNLPIRRDHILNPLIVSLGDKKGEILDYKLLHISRPEVINITVERNKGNPKTSLNINFLILEKNDGFTAQLLYSGDPNANLAIKGVIEGVRQIKTDATLSEKQFYKNIFIDFGTFFLGLIALFVYIQFVWPYPKDIYLQILGAVWNGKKFSLRTRWVILGIIPTIVLIIMFVMVLQRGYTKAQEDAKKDLTKIIPAEITGYVR